MNGKPTLAFYGIKHHSFMHDHNLCFMQNGKILQYLQLERYTRRKYDNRLDLYLEELVENGSLELPDEFDMVSVNSFIGNAFISENGRIRFESPALPRLSVDLEPALARRQLANREWREINACNCPHELAHIASCLPFFGEFRESSLLVSFDGGSSLGNFAAFHFTGGKLKILECSWDELGYLSKFFNDNPLNFNILGAGREEHCCVPGKLMGYASYGDYDEKIEDWLKGNGYFMGGDGYYWKNSNAILQSIRDTFGTSITGFDNSDPFLQNIAATFQHIFERDFTRKIVRLQEQTGADYLYYAGGCALNIVTNAKIVDMGIFKDVFIPPCCNDSGLSIGAASFLEWKKGNMIQTHTPYLCNTGLDDNAGTAVSSEAIAQVAEIILSDGIVGVCNGNAEAGPRALGNRSLIARADDMEIARKLSMNVKKREWYRPVAPIMLARVAEKVAAQPVHHLAKFMLLDFSVKKEYEKYLGGVIHANNTARIQTIGKESDNPFMFNLLTYMYEKHNVFALINTSFNAQGEPIVHTPENAVQSAKKMGLQGLVINNVFHKTGEGL
jgi:carbamoyltransferase